MMRQKGFAPIIILVLMMLVVLGYFGYKYFKSNNLHFQAYPSLKFVPIQCEDGDYLKQCKKGLCCCPNGAICD